MDHSFDDLPVDPDVLVDAHAPLVAGPPHPATVRELLHGRGDVLTVIALGGAVGGGARWLLGQALPHGATGFPWSTFLANVSGCLLLGVLMVLVIEVWGPTRLVRPFWGVGVLGGYTTYSAFTAEAVGLMRAGVAPMGLLYLFGSVAAGVLATWVGLVAVRGLVVRPRERRRP
jgi:fluoride exporter